MFRELQQGHESRSLASRSCCKPFFLPQEETDRRSLVFDPDIPLLNIPSVSQKTGFKLDKLEVFNSPNFDTVGKNSSTINQKSFGLLHQNIQCVSTSIEKLEFFLQCEGLHNVCVCLTEHWKSKEQLELHHINGFSLASSFCRDQGEHGGSSIYVKEGVVWKERTNICSQSEKYNFEVSAVEIDYCLFNCVVLCIYLPGRGSIDVFMSKLDLILDVLVSEDIGHQRTSKTATMEIQQLVLKRLNTSVATQIVQSVGCLQESFTGTLQRCLENLEKSCHEQEHNLSASDAVRQIVSAAYNIDLNHSSSFSIVSTLMDRLRQLLSSFAPPWSSSSQIQCSNFQWQLQVATNMIEKLSASKLARTIGVQCKEHIKSSHESFLSAIRSLDHQLSDQLEQTEEQRIAIRKRHAPKFARLALESTSLCDLIRYGMPKQIKEIGRGQYGVVSSCEPWAGINPCAFKSVVPPDDRHWNDLAMEFFYTRTIPGHPRIVKLRGSVIDYTYGGGSSPAVLLIMERMTRDLYCGLRSGLTWLARLRIAIDVIEGIRYLHSQGLVHRDIKLKNVLLDSKDRAKLTDFGFCIPEAMMSGSIVGTPVHMAPELLSGRYDSKVDVYAFGILFWYICAGQVKLPTHFDQFQNKEQLWNSVRRGIRPEFLPNFEEECWSLMEQCWAADPVDRPLLGYVQPQLEAIYNSVKAKSQCQSASSTSPT
ncbi:dual serine/threonine and tyrosine protein kinase [Diabrotica virgifera virgifera]|uniref:Dual serine/threonine and tyrosine protein kinase n=2 Tax=Diabrotica virgifera virgifera TaxID=50390 RepID=A0ABM5L969_DIAVI|nr:dual serine/threonine and tyrosine protein kinase [Diabrotica virgifera virgifera]